MKTTATVSLSADVLKATKAWAAEEKRPLSGQIEMLLERALKKRAQRKATRKAIPA